MIERIARFAIASLLVAWCFPAPAATASLPSLLFAPAQPTDSEIVHVTVVGETVSTCETYFASSVDYAASKITLFGISTGGIVPCPQTWWATQVQIGHLRAGVWQVEAKLDNQIHATSTLIVQPSPTTVVVGSYDYYQSNFRIQVEWRDPRNGQVGLAPGLALSDRAAQFWFFDPRNPEVTVKVLDGWAINNHFWLFASTLSGVEMTLKVGVCVESDPPFCGTPKEYHVPAGSGLDIIDVTAF